MSKITPSHRHNTPPLIRLSEVNRHYTSNGLTFRALENITLDILRGKFVGVIGKSGAGKSTLVNVISGVDNITSGEIWIDETPIHLLSEDKLSRWRGLHIGVVYQSFELLSQLSLIDNILLPMDLCGLYKRGRSYERALELLEMVELTAHAHKNPTAISGGQQQRVAIARALANDPDLILADEPTGNLDSVTSEVILNIFRELISRGKTVVMVTHDHSLANIFDHLIQISDGKIVSETNQETGGL